MKNTRLVKLRADRTQGEIARALGCATSTYAMIETGRRFPRRGLQARLAELHGVTVDYLFFQQKYHES
ncbi:helix-turn-helix transcriptional regulator [Paenibacillus sp. UNC496MF]|uniref:helix-turn-helix transcriptional regulator n=1 Tax=Paenibacillus sp. UNC496MF TaxID=1502753 RepID=UPI000B8161F8|nr:helix-turn-helix transcriptional regulator [Paenibacillus sp. UNC496MF]